MVQQVLQRFDFTYSSAQTTPLSTRHSLSALPSDESVEPSGPYPELVGCLMYLMTCTRPDLAYPLSILARYVAPGRHRPEHMAAAKRVLRYLCSTSGLGLVLGGRRPVVLTDNKAMLALCREHKQEHRTKHIALRYFLARELLQRDQLRLAYVASEANTAHIFTKALPPGDHQRFCTMLGFPTSERGDTEEEVQQPTPSPKLPPRRTTQGKRDAVRGGAKEGAAKERPKRAAHLMDFLKYERLGVPKALLVQKEEYEEEKGAEGEMEQICCFGVNLPHEPASMEEALAGDDRVAWLASREDEFQSHMENETWTLTNLPPGRKALECMWVLRVKTDAEGRLERRKTRLVIKGFQQRERIDFQEVFAPVAKAPTLRLLLAAAAVCGWKVEQMDVKTAFLYGVVDEEIYMKQPEGYDDGSGRVCRLYGHLWPQTSSKVLVCKAGGGVGGSWLQS
ncbi:unnamed protein product [Closterium sp. NIES-54]